ncbi:MAG: hypothetical protein AAF636_06030 [Pseudomonadota bacterium]
MQIMQPQKLAGVARAAPQGRRKGSKLDTVFNWLDKRVESQPDIPKPQLAEALKLKQDLAA